MTMRINFRRLIVLAILGLAAVPHLSWAGDDYLVIAHSSSGADALASQALSDIFLKKTKTWPDGASVTPVDQVSRSPVRGKFSLAIHKKPLGAIKAYWNKLIFSGKGTPPQELGTDAEIIAFVMATPGAIGYVDPSTNTSGVKVIVVH